MMAMRDTAKSFGIVIICGLIGIFFAISSAVMYNEGIIVDELVSGTISLSDIMFILFFAWVVLGLFMMFSDKLR